jgi:hypothetical protein
VESNGCAVSCSASFSPPHPDRKEKASRMVASKKVGTLIGYSFVSGVRNAIVHLVAMAKFGLECGKRKNLSTWLPSTAEKSF